MQQGYNDPTTPPKEYEVVKLLLVCAKKGNDWSQTTHGYYASGRYFHDQYQGECYKVVGWADKDSNTDNYGTETI